MLKECISKGCSLFHIYSQAGLASSPYGFPVFRTFSKWPLKGLILLSFILKFTNTYLQFSFTHLELLLYKECQY